MADVPVDPRLARAINVAAGGVSLASIIEMEKLCGRTLNLMIALVLAVSYSNAVGIMQAVVAQGKLGFMVGWWPLHAAALAAITLLFVWRNNTNSAWHPARLLSVVRRMLFIRKAEAA